MRMCISLCFPEVVDSAAYGSQVLQKRGQLSQRKHVGAVAFGHCRILMRLYEKTVHANGYSRARYGLYEVGTAACNAFWLVGLLQ